MSRPLSGRIVGDVWRRKSEVSSPSIWELTLELTPESININIADVQELRTLHRMGEKLTMRIIEHRSGNGPFRTVAELDRVKGNGQAILQANRHRRRVR
ncbi:MAG: ComEA family DNA-binding protein [Candidatus Sumerlaeaceae bacterium]